MCYYLLAIKVFENFKFFRIFSKFSFANKLIKYNIFRLHFINKVYSCWEKKAFTILKYNTISSKSTCNRYNFIIISSKLNTFFHILHLSSNKNFLIALFPFESEKKKNNNNRILEFHSTVFKNLYFFFLFRPTHTTCSFVSAPYDASTYYV